MPAKERKKNCKEGGPVTKNAQEGSPKDTESLQKIYKTRPWGRLGATDPHFDDQQGAWMGGTPPNCAPKSQKKRRSASDSVLPTNSGTSKKGHTLYLNFP